MAISKRQKVAVWVLTTLALIILVCLPVFAANLATWISTSSGTAKDITSVWGAARSDVFATGNSGLILHYDGSTWTSTISSTLNDLSGIWGSAGSDVFGVGKSGTILHYDGSSWSAMSSGTPNDLYAIWGSDGSDVFVMGKSGTILHYDGSGWSAMSSGTPNDLYAIWGSAGSDVFGVGKSGTILHYDGYAWGTMSSGTPNDLYAIWGSAGTDVLAAGKSGVIVHYDGSAWKSTGGGPAGDLYGIWGTTGKDVFAVGSSGTIVHYDGSNWSSMDRNTLNGLRSVWGFSSFDVFAVGGSGTILRYVPPAITSISPVQGDQGATLNVTITGTNLTDATEVRFGTGVAVNSLAILNANQIVANITIVAGAAAGPRDVSVTAPGGSFALAGSFTVKQALPTVTSVSPDQDRQGATLNVTITGSNLTGANEIRFGAGIAVNSFTVLSSNQISANITIAADAAVGARDVSGTAPGGSFTLKNSFAVRPALPTITALTPDQGNQETSFIVTINGTNLTGASKVLLGSGIVVNSFTVLSSNQISASITIAPDAAVGARDVSVTTPGGSFALTGSFTVKQALPVITSISPLQGSQGATLNVTITGSNLTGANEVRFGDGIAVSSFDVLNSNHVAANITIVAGATTGATDVSITTPGGSVTLPNSFTIKQGLPVITSINPNQGSQGETLSVLISGSNFDGATSLSFGTGVAIDGFTNLSPTQLSVTVEIDSEAVTGSRDVTVTTPGGSSTLANSFVIKERSLGTLFIALIWVGIAIVSGLFIYILNMLRKKRASKI